MCAVSVTLRTEPSWSKDPVGCHEETSRRRFTKGLYEGHLFTQQRTVPSHHGFLNIVSSMSESEYKTSCVEKFELILFEEEFQRVCLQTLKNDDKVPK